MFDMDFTSSTVACKVSVMQLRKKQVLSAAVGRRLQLDCKLKTGPANLHLPEIETLYRLFFVLQDQKDQDQSKSI